MSRATKALAALAALAASASAAHPAAVPQAAPVNCSRHIRVGVFDDANPFAGAFLTGWMDSGSERPAPRSVLPGVGREPGCVTLPVRYVQLGP